MYAFIGTRREFDQFCRDRLGMSAHQAETSRPREAVWALGTHGVRGLKGPLELVDTGTVTGREVLEAIQEIMYVNAMVK